MNELLELAQEQIDLAKKRLQEYIDNPNDFVRQVVLAHIGRAKWHIDAFYKEQQK